MKNALHALPAIRKVWSGSLGLGFVVYSGKPGIRLPVLILTIVSTIYLDDRIKRFFGFWHDCSYAFVSVGTMFIVLVNPSFFGENCYG
jgi:hypothetical protein